MAIPTDTKNSLIGGVEFTHASLHTDYPGVTGANELVGGSYARAAIVIAVPSGGTRNLSAQVQFGVPATTLRFVGFWSDTQFIGAVPNGGAIPKNFVAAPEADEVADANRIYCPSHTWEEGQSIVFYNGTPPGGLTEGTTYFVRDATRHTLKVAATSGGAAIELTAAPSFGCVVAAITEVTYATVGIHRLDTATVTIPD